jgi:hypothetical protein
MAATKTQRSTAAKKAAATRRRRAKVESKEHDLGRAVDRTTELSDEVLKSVESGQRRAIEAVRKFVDTVDQTLPPHGETASRRQEIIDSAMEMADRLVQTEYDFLRKVVDSAGKSLTRSEGGK